MQYLPSKPKSVEIFGPLGATLTWKVAYYNIFYCYVLYFPTKTLICSAKETKPKQVNAACLRAHHLTTIYPERVDCEWLQKQHIWPITTPICACRSQPSIPDLLTVQTLILFILLHLPCCHNNYSSPWRSPPMWVVISCFHSWIIWLFFLMRTGWPNGYPHNGYLGERLPLLLSARTAWR